MRNFKKSSKKVTETVVLKKSFSSFAEGIIEMCDLNSTIAKLLDIKGTEDATIENVYGKIIDITKENYPDIVNRKNIHWEFQISARRIYVKTALFVGFGWNVKSIRENQDDKAIIRNQYNMKITLFGINQNDTKKKLLANNWEIVENKER